MVADASLTGDATGNDTTGANGTVLDDATLPGCTSAWCDCSSCSLGVDDGGAARLLDLELGVVDERLQDALEVAHDRVPHGQRHRDEHRVADVEGEGDHVREQLDELAYMYP